MHYTSYRAQPKGAPPRTGSHGAGQLILPPDAPPDPSADDQPETDRPVVPALPGNAPTSNTVPLQAEPTADGAIIAESAIRVTRREDDRYNKSGPVGCRRNESVAVAMAACCSTRLLKPTFGADGIRFSDQNRTRSADATDRVTGVHRHPQLKGPFTPLDGDPVCAEHLMGACGSEPSVIDRRQTVPEFERATRPGPVSEHSAW